MVQNILHIKPLYTIALYTITLCSLMTCGNHTHPSKKVQNSYRWGESGLYASEITTTKQCFDYKEPIMVSYTGYAYSLVTIHTIDINIQSHDNPTYYTEMLASPDIKNQLPHTIKSKEHIGPFSVLWEQQNYTLPKDKDLYQGVDILFDITYSHDDGKIYHAYNSIYIGIEKYSYSPSGDGYVIVSCSDMDY